jgi:hypothetical protein
MATRIIHFGEDTCHRLSVLKSAGYFVAECDDVTQLQAALQSELGIDAVLLTDREGEAFEDAIRIARSFSSVPLILFRDTNLNIAEAGFDLVIPVLTPPEQWLDELGALIKRMHAIGTRSVKLRA